MIIEIMEKYKCNEDIQNIITDFLYGTTEYNKKKNRQNILIEFKLMKSIKLLHKQYLQQLINNVKYTINFTNGFLNIINNHIKNDCKKDILNFTDNWGFKKKITLENSQIIFNYYVNIVKTQQNLINDLTLLFNHKNMLKYMTEIFKGGYEIYTLNGLKK